MPGLHRYAHPRLFEVAKTLFNGFAKINDEVSPDSRFAFADLDWNGDRKVRITEGLLRATFKSHDVVLTCRDRQRRRRLPIQLVASRQFKLQGKRRVAGLDRLRWKLNHL